MLDQIPIRLKESDIERLGIVLDADEDAESRWIQLRERLRQAGFNGAPDQPATNETVIDFRNEFGNLLRLGVWIMPDNQLPGMLENFLGFLVPDGDAMLPHVDRFLEGIPQADRLFSDSAAPKARIHAYLAVQKNQASRWGWPSPSTISMRRKLMSPHSWTGCAAIRN